MKTVLASLVLATSLVAATAPAAAQYGQRHGFDQRFDRNGQLGRELDRIGQQIARGEQRGNLTRREAGQLRQQHSQLWRTAQRFYASNGLDRSEAQQLRQRIDGLQDRLRFERRDNDRQGDRRGWR